MGDWRQDYEKKRIDADAAAQMVKSGDKVVFTAGREAFALGLALAARKDELKGVKVHVPSPGYDFGWYDEGWNENFEVTVGFPTATCQEAIDAKRVDFNYYIKRLCRLFILFLPDVEYTQSFKCLCKQRVHCQCLSIFVDSPLQIPQALKQTPCLRQNVRVARCQRIGFLIKAVGLVVIADY